MSKSLLGAIAVSAGGAMVSGFGASAGRDLYKSAKRSSGLVLLFAALAAAVSLPFIGMRNLARGHTSGGLWRAVGDILLVPSGLAIGIGIGLLGETVLNDAPAYSITMPVGAVGLVAAAAGAILGLSQRGATNRKRAIMASNEAFLLAQGIEQTGEAEISHYDGGRNALRFVERTPTSIVFLAVGKRNKRAYITLSPEGEMTSYSGVVALGSTRMDTAA